MNLLMDSYLSLFKTYEDAELECLKNLCDILEQQLKELKQ